MEINVYGVMILIASLFGVVIILGFKFNPPPIIWWLWGVVTGAISMIYSMG
jgi:hypothetical protein